MRKQQQGIVVFTILLCGFAVWFLVHQIQAGTSTPPRNVGLAPTPQQPEAESSKSDIVGNGITPVEVAPSPVPSPTSTPIVHDMNAAMKDLQAHHPLPGMPNLDLPVFLMGGSYVCTSQGALANPDRKITLALKACTIIPEDIRVSVIPPSPDDPQEYLRDHYLGSIQVFWDSGQMSDARVNSGWVGIVRLRNLARLEEKPSTMEVKNDTGNSCELVGGYQIGMSLAELKTLYETKSLRAPNCGMTPFPSGYRCAGCITCKGQMTVAEVSADVTFSLGPLGRAEESSSQEDAKLFALAGNFDPGEFESVKRAFVEKFGKPQTDLKCDDASNRGSLRPEDMEKIAQSQGCEGLFWPNDGIAVLLHQVPDGAGHRFSVMAAPNDFGKKKYSSCPR